MWHLLERHIDKHCWQACLGIQWKNDVQKLNQHVKLKSEVWKGSVKKIKAHWTQISLWNRAAWAQPLAGSHCFAELLHILLLSNRSWQQLDSASLSPANKQLTMSVMPTGTSSAQLLIRSTLILTRETQLAHHQKYIPDLKKNTHTNTHTKKVAQRQDSDDQCTTVSWLNHFPSGPSLRVIIR